VRTTDSWSREADFERMSNDVKNTNRLRVVAATPISEELIQLILAAEPRVDFIRDQTLLPPMRMAGDHAGDPAFRRSRQQQRAFEDLVDSADALYGVPDEDPAALRRTADVNMNLRWVHTMPAGGGGQVKAANLSSDQLARIAFSTSAGVHAESLAEFAIFGLLAGAKDLSRLLEQQRNRQWSGRWPMALISQQRILLVGLGSIGRATAAKLKALGATVVGISRHDDPVPNVDEVASPDRLAEVVAGVDGIVVSLPGTAATEGLISAKVLGAAKAGTTLVSVGRGTVIDEAALLDALDHGRIGFAVLDVFSSEPLSAESRLWKHPGVLISPHTAALNPEEDRLIAELFVSNATKFLDGEQLTNRVNTVEFY
jgi:phosphoglycerate dehydrogenase-like enzyme